MSRHKHSCAGSAELTMVHGLSLGTSGCSLGGADSAASPAWR
jgi:hypothetical protein